MNQPQYNLLLADDDEDDCAFFKDALDEVPFSVNLLIVNDGVELMNFLLDNSFIQLPDILFLDLNMPRKSGFECLTEIKNIDQLKDIPIIIFSTSLDMKIVDSMYEKGVTYYIQKPGDFSKLKKIIENAITAASENDFKQPLRNHFILQP